MSNHTAQESVNTDVLIMGAGPAGLMVALALSTLGIDVKILDRRLPGEIAGQGDGLQPRTTEMWDALGMGPELKEMCGQQLHRAVLYVPNEDGSGIKQSGQAYSYNINSTPHPYTAVIHTSSLEGTLLHALQKRGVVVEQPFIPQSLKVVEKDGSPAETYVEVAVAKLDEEYIRVNGIRQADRGTLVDNDTPEAINERLVIRAKYVLGCDGARSWVRRAVKIALEGEVSEDLVWGVIDFTPETDLPTTRAKNLIASPLAGGIAYIPRENNSARIYVRLPTDPAKVAADQTQSSASADSREKIMQTIKTAFLPYTMEFTKITWCNEYKVGQRVASTFSFARRVYLLGDAGRTHSPLAGQGANGAMTDGWNLAWKMAYVLRGHSNPSILDTYEEERRAHALQLIEFDREIFRLFRKDTFTSEGYFELWRRHMMFLAGIGHKCLSRLTVPDTDEVAPGLIIGERVPYASVIRHSDWQPLSLLELMAYDGRFKLIVFPGDTQDLSVARRFRAFVVAFVEKMEADLGVLLDILTILNTPKEASIEGLRDLLALRAIENVYVDEVGRLEAQNNGKLYEQLGIQTEGTVILVRPDSVVAMVTEMRVNNVYKIASYFERL